jgi:hypothetical protein
VNKSLITPCVAALPGDGQSSGRCTWNGHFHWAAKRCHLKFVLGNEGCLETPCLSDDLGVANENGPSKPVRSCCKNPAGQQGDSTGGQVVFDSGKRSQKYAVIRIDVDLAWSIRGRADFRYIRQDSTYRNGTPGASRSLLDGKNPARPPDNRVYFPCVGARWNDQAACDEIPDNETLDEIHSCQLLRNWIAIANPSNRW